MQQADGSAPVARAATAETTSTTLTAMTTSTSATPITLLALLGVAPDVKLSQIELNYRAEGNANLVLALPEFKKVLRLPKRQQPTTPDDCHVVFNSLPTTGNVVGGDVAASGLGLSGTPSDRVMVASAFDSTSAVDVASSASPLSGELTMSDFTAYIELMRQLIGDEFVHRADIAVIPDPADRRWINEHTRASRPIERRHKEFHGQYGLLMADATQLPSLDTFDAALSNLQSNVSGAANDVYAVEIKPKQGWRMDEADVDDDDDDGTTGLGLAWLEKSMEPVAKLAKNSCRCRYCSMQLLKLQNDKITDISAYCPIELFSGDRSRMLAALDALFVCPQNNLRLFKNGNLIYGDTTAPAPASISIAELNLRHFQGNNIMLTLIKQLLVSCLLRDYRREQDDSDGVGDTDALGDLLKVQLAAANVGSRADNRIAIVEANALARSSRAEEPPGRQAVAVGQPKVASVEPLLQRASTNATPKATNSASPSPSLSLSPNSSSSSSTTTNREMPKNVSTKQASEADIKTEARPEKDTDTDADADTNTETPLTATTMTTTRTRPRPKLVATRAQIGNAEGYAVEGFALPKCSVLRKVFQLQLLAKHNLRHMLDNGYAQQSERTYAILAGLLQRAKTNVITYDSLRPEEAYMLGATMLDCSIIIAFQELNTTAALKMVDVSPHIVYLPAYGKYYRTNVTLIDLDPKPDNHLHKYLQRNQDIRNCYRRS